MQLGRPNGLSMPEVGGYQPGNYGNSSQGLSPGQGRTASGSGGAGGGIVLFCKPCPPGCPMPTANGGCVPGFGSLPEPGKDDGIPSGGSTCLSSETTVTDINGKKRPISNLNPGDQILGVDCAGNLAMQTVVQADSFESPTLLIKIGDKEVTCTASHLFIGPGIVEVRASEISAGAKVLGESGETLTVTSVEAGSESEQVTAIEVAPDHMFFAGGILHHNKVFCQANSTTFPTPF